MLGLAGIVVVNYVIIWEPLTAIQLFRLQHPQTDVHNLVLCPVDCHQPETILRCDCGKRLFYVLPCTGSLNDPPRIFHAADPFLFVFKF